jgi:hypothetical protein
MSTLLQYDPDRFTYNEVRTEKSTLIVCTCNQCGAAKVVAGFSDSLIKWEEGHQCRTDHAA